MTGRSQQPRPTEGELEILHTLWRLGPSTVREVRDALPRDAGYTTVLKLLQIMFSKGLVERDESERSHRYRARAGQVETQTQLVRDLLSRAFEGSASQLIQRALSARPVDPEELSEIEQMIDQMRGEGEP